MPAILAGPLLALAAAALVIAAARGYPAALVGLIVLAAVDQGCYGLSYAVYPQSAMLEEYVASARTPPGNPDGRVVGSLLRFDQPGLRTGDLMTLAGWRRADGYAGLEPRRQLDYHLLPALRVAGVRWVQRDPSTAGIAGLKPYDDRWMEVPNPLPRVRLVTQTKTSRDPAIDIARIRPDTTALMRSPAGSAGVDAGHGRADGRTSRPARNRGRLSRPAIAGGGRKLSPRLARRRRRPAAGQSTASTAISWAAWWARENTAWFSTSSPRACERGWLASWLGLSLAVPLFPRLFGPSRKPRC